MRLSKRKMSIVDMMEKDGYVWLSHLSVNAQMRFRNKTRAGFKGFLKVEGLTFLTKRVADAVSVGVKDKQSKRLSCKQQLAVMEQQLIDLEKENYKLKGVGFRQEQAKVAAYEEE